MSFPSNSISWNVSRNVASLQIQSISEDHAHNLRICFTASRVSSKIGIAIAKIVRLRQCSISGFYRRGMMPTISYENIELSGVENARRQVVTLLIATPFRTKGLSALS